MDTVETGGDSKSDSTTQLLDADDDVNEVQDSSKTDSETLVDGDNLDLKTDSSTTRDLEIGLDSETIPASQTPESGESDETDETAGEAEQEQLNRSRSSSSLSSSSLSSSSSSSSEDCFQLGNNETAESSPIGSTDDDDDDNDGTSAPPQEPTTSNNNEPDHPNSDTKNSAVPRVTFQIEDSRPRDDDDNGKASSSSYRIPSHVFARTKSSAPAEWSTASNESLFSIHVGNASFSRDQLFLQGKLSGDLGMSNPFLELTSAANKPGSGSQGQSSLNMDEDFRAAEAKAAETMREVIRENAESLAKDKDNNNSNSNKAVVSQPVKAKESQPSYTISKTSQLPEDSTRPFAFPVLAGDGNRNVSFKAGAMKPPDQQPPVPMLKATLVAGESTKPNQIAGQDRWFAFSGFSCCRPSSY